MTIPISLDKTLQNVGFSSMPKVVMLVANDVSIDGRVQKIAKSVSKIAEVTVMGITSGGSMQTHNEYGFQVVLFPVGQTKISATKKARKYLGRVLIYVNKRMKIPYLRRFAHKRVIQANNSELSIQAEDKTWRQVLPQNKSYSALMTPAIERIAPDVLHAHDVHLLSVAGEYVLANSKTHLIYDSHEYIRGLPTHTHEIRKAFAEVENEFIPSTTCVVTVSGAIANRLNIDHELKELPVVIMNTPMPVDTENESAKGIRETIGLGPEVPLVVYSGGINITRGLEIVIQALRYLPNVHLVATSNRVSWYTEQLQELATQSKANGRLHFAPYVATDQVVSYLSSADVGISPLPANVVNYDLALPNKLFDYIQAGLPIAVSNCTEQMALVEDLQVGVSYKWSEPEECANAIQKLLDAKTSILRRYEDIDIELESFLWPSQEEKLLNLYSSLLENPK